jgi:hypothetical protein
MRIVIAAFALLLAGCGEEQTAAPRDPTTESWYAPAVQQLVSLNQQARAAIKKGNKDEAGKLIQQGEAVSTRIISVPHPTFDATVAASDVDQLYGEMLLSNRNYGWARLFFQKNLARWKVWRPQTEEAVRRMKEASAEIDECDRRMTE